MFDFLLTTNFALSSGLFFASSILITSIFYGSLCWIYDKSSREYENKLAKFIWRSNYPSGIDLGAKIACEITTCAFFFLAGFLLGPVLCFTVTFYWLPLTVGLLILIAHLAKFTIRLRRKLGLHVTDKSIHVNFESKEA